MRIIGERYQTALDLQIKFRGQAGDDFIKFIKEAGLKNLNEDITNKPFDFPASNSNTLVYNLALVNRNVVTGSDYSKTIDLSFNNFNNDYNNDYK
jgi:hypothetical protein